MREHQAGTGGTNPWRVTAVIGLSTSVLGGLVADALQPGLAQYWSALGRVSPRVLGVSVGLLILALFLLRYMLLARQRAMPGPLILVMSYPATQPPMQHRGGERVTAIGALSDTVWHVLSGTDHGGAVLSGPNVRLEPGLYKASFWMRAKFTEPQPSGQFKLEVTRRRDDADPVTVKEQWFSEEIPSEYHVNSRPMCTTGRRLMGTTFS